MLGLLLAGAIAGAVVFSTGTSSHTAATAETHWSAWAPPAGTAGDGIEIGNAIASHVAPKYKLPNGDAFVSVESGLPRVPDTNAGFIPVRAYVVHSTGAKAAVAVSAQQSLMYIFCGVGENCSVPGTPSVERRNLLLRESLELALNSFHYIPTLKTAVVLLPPLPGTVTVDVQYSITAVVFQRADLAAQLSQPLDKTLDPAELVTPLSLSASDVKATDTLARTHQYFYTSTRISDGAAPFGFSYVLELTDRLGSSPNAHDLLA